MLRITLAVFVLCLVAPATGWGDSKKSAPTAPKPPTWTAAQPRIVERGLDPTPYRAAWRHAMRQPADSDLRVVLQDTWRVVSQRRYDAPVVQMALNQLQVNVNNPLRTTYRIRQQGLVYQYYSGQGYRLQPLTTFWSILEPGQGIRDDGGIVAAFDLALAVSIPREEGLTLPYILRWPDIPLVWRSSMAEAVAAQAALRVYQRSGEQRHLDAALGFGRAARSSRLEQTDGCWFPLYTGLPELLVLNGHLQVVLAMRELTQYDPSFQESFDCGVSAVRSTLGTFAGPGWPRYAPKRDATVGYARLQNQQLDELSIVTGDPMFSHQAGVWRSQMAEPPALQRLRGPVRTVKSNKNLTWRQMRIWSNKPGRLVVRVYTAEGQYLRIGADVQLTSGTSRVQIALPRRAGSYQLVANHQSWGNQRAENIDLGRVVIKARG